MLSILLGDVMAKDLYLTGERVTAGAYREIGTYRQIKIQEGNRLPPGPDGSATAYVCLDHAWESPALHESRPRNIH